MKKDFVDTPLIIKREKNLDDLTLKKFIDCNYKQNLLLNPVLQLLANGANYFKNLIIIDCINIDGKLYY